MLWGINRRGGARCTDRQGFRLAPCGEDLLDVDQLALPFHLNWFNGLSMCEHHDVGSSHEPKRIGTYKGNMDEYRN